MRHVAGVDIGDVALINDLSNDYNNGVLIDVSYAFMKYTIEDIPHCC